MLIFATKLREHRSLSTNIVKRTGATVSTGVYARRAMGLNGAERDESFTFYRTESVTR